MSEIKEYHSSFTGPEVDALLTKVNDGSITADIEKELADKADKTGYYPQMSVGQADNLPDRGDVLEGFIGFRESAGAGNSIEDGTANVQELLGESLVWNQKRNIITSIDAYGYSCISQGNKVVLTNVSASTPTYGNMGIIDDFLPIAGHKYILLSNSLMKLAITSTNGFVLDINNIGIAPSIDYSGMYLRVQVAPSLNIGESETFSFDITDLTLMFGAGKEPSTIDEFYARVNQLVGVDFNAYNEGEVLGVNIKGIKSVNDNAFNGEYAKVLGGREYCADGTITSMGFAKEIGGATEAIVLDSENKFTPSENGYVYASGTDICIHLVHTGYKDHVYTEHEVSESSFDLTKYFPNGMHGLNGVRDSATPKKTTQRFGVVDLGTLNWQVSEGVNSAKIMVSSGIVSIAKHPSTSAIVAGLLCSRYTTCSANDVYTNTIGVSLNAAGDIRIYDSSFTDAVSFKAAMSGVMLYYELATPIETEIDPQLNMNYKVWDFGTEELLTDGKSAPVLARTIYGFNATDTIRGNKVKNEEQDTRLHTLESEVVRKGDYSPDNSVGFADDLVGRGESVPAEFSFRASGGKSIKDGAARIKRLKGNSVVWNQILNNEREGTKTINGITIIGNSDGSFTLNGTATADAWIVFTISDRINIVSGHKWFYTGCPSGGSESTYCLWEGSGKIQDVGNGGIAVINDTHIAPRILVRKDYTCTNLVFTPRLYDLTRMFRAGNEPTTIEEFYARKPIVEDEYAYNEGEVIHMTAEGIKSVGDNAWDEEWEVGRLNTDTGEPTTGGNAIRMANMMRVLPNETYYCKSHVDTWLLFFDSDGNLIKGYSTGIEQYQNANKVQDSSFTTPHNAAYLRAYFNQYLANTTTYNNDIMITLVHSGWKQDTDAGYQPHWEDRLIFDQRIKDEFPNGMSKWDMVYNKNGKGYIVHGLGVEDLGDLTYVYQPPIEGTFPHGHFNTVLPNKAIGNNNLLCAKYNTIVDWASIGIRGDDSSADVYIKDSAYTDAASFKAAMAGVMLYYQLAEPTIIEYDEPFNLDYRVADFGTEEAIAEQPSAPISADIIYQFNAVDMIREHELEIAELQSIIATMQAQLASLTNKE